MCPYDLFPGTLISEDVPPGFCQNPDDLLHRLLGESNEPVKILGAPVMGRCLRLIDMNNDFFRASGSWGLYFAYPLVYWEMPGIKNPYWAPLFLWKIKMSTDNGHLVISRYNDHQSDGEEAESPVFNRLLAARLNRSQHIKIDMPDEYKDENIPWAKLPEVIEDTLKGWDNCVREHFIPNQLSPFSGLSDAPQAAVYPFAALGYAKFAKQSILENLERLSQGVGDNSHGMGCLDALVSQAEYKTDSPASEPSGDTEKHLVTTSDISQESAIWKAREARLTILQGPPGTGKSQTIVNLIADALARKKRRIAVICHHEAALRVVANRLNACGKGNENLRQLATLITKPQSDRLNVIKSIVKIQAPDYTNNATVRREDACYQIEEAERHMEDLNKKLRGNIRPMHRYGALRAIFDRVSHERGFDIHSHEHRDFREAAKDAFPAEFNDNSNQQRERLKRYVANYKESGYDIAPWRINRADAENIVTDKIRAMLNYTRKFFNETAETRESLHRSPVFAEHPMLLQHFSGFSAKPGFAREYAKALKDAQEGLSEVLPQATISRMFDEFRKSGNSRTLEECQQHFYKQWEPFVKAHDFQRSEPMLVKTIAAKCPARGDEWLDYFDAGVAWNIYAELPAKPTINESDDAEMHGKALAKAIKEKEQQDALWLLGRFHERADAKRHLDRVGLLRQRRGAGRPKTQLRDIFHKGTAHISDIYPVLLATPDAACQILPLKPDLFDLIIIDEASQVFTSDALPILYRAKRAVISGDEMQMPPSDFFALSDDDSDGGDTEEDNDESAPQPQIPADGVYELLKVVKSAGESDRKLLVHYRSAARELIDFSNYAFYDGRLEIPAGVTKAPSFMTEDGRGRPRPIKVVEAAGKFEVRVNEKENDAIIEQLRKVWGSAPDAPQKYSVGVIVFNQAQRNALKRKLAEVAKDDDEFKGWLKQSEEFKDDDGESAGFFVRSVERVQGDERDIIIMGTTYDKNGRHYGPINIKEKGRRRLNVAITRAKQGMIVITSLDIDTIANEGDRGGDSNDDSDNARERWFFWKYMQYAQAVSDGREDGVKSVLRDLQKHDKTPVPTGNPENGFEEQVGEFIRECGYEVAYQVGESGFRIDIGVRANTGEYFCGVECDGAPYHSGWRARHRDVWRQDILESKGWKIVRVWSTKWFHNKDGAKEKLKSALKKAAEKQIPEHPES